MYNTIMELFDQIRRVSFVFFVAVGLAHFISGLMYVNNYSIPLSGLVNRVLFIPFVVAGLAYGLANLKYNLLEYGKDSKFLNYAFLIFGILIFLILISIEFFVADSSCPLSPSCL